MGGGGGFLVEAEGKGGGWWWGQATESASRCALLCQNYPLAIYRLVAPKRNQRHFRQLKGAAVTAGGSVPLAGPSVPFMGGSVPLTGLI